MIWLAICIMGSYHNESAPEAKGRVNTGVASVVA